MEVPVQRNVSEFTVSELSRALKRTVEDAYGHVRVRGEVSGFKRAASGHLYMTLKDTDAVLDAVCWRGTAGRLAVQPEDGLDIIVTGRLTTYPGRSKYQIVIEAVELAGEGALLKLLEERRKKLAAEGLFDEERKRPLPYLPSVIGVVTSPTGAVIRDILHRLADRFPRHVLVWPVLVQGDGAAEQVAAAIEGFNALSEGGPVPRPDVLIVARGGGSLEDLWAFNEEVVVRAAAGSAIPLISAVGHETDTTLIDFASDRRAPTPTAAAEIAVPVRGELVTTILDLERRLVGAGQRNITERSRAVEGLARGLPRPRTLLENAMQRLDDLGERHQIALPRHLARMDERIVQLGARLRSPNQQIQQATERLEDRASRLKSAGWHVVRRVEERYVDQRLAERLIAAKDQRIQRKAERLEALSDRLESVSYESVLKRGFAVVHGSDGVVMDAARLSTGDGVRLQFRDGERGATIADGPLGSTSPQSGVSKSGTSKKSAAKTKPAPNKAPATKTDSRPKQQDLF